MKNILVTGGAGFMGSDFIRYMIENSDYNIINYDKLTYAGNPENLKDVKSSRYRFVKGDINDSKLLHKTIEENRIDCIVHFAAETHVDRSIESAEVFIRTNVMGTMVLLEAVKKYSLRFHHISTDEVYGHLEEDDPPFDETSNYDPRSPYAASKAASDHLVRSYINTFGIKATLSCCCNNFGPYQYPEKIIPLFITNLLQGKKLPVYGNGSNIRNWLHVRDHSRAVATILRKGKIGETYCIGGIKEISNIELTKKILNYLGKSERNIVFAKDRKGHDFRYALDDSKIKKKLGWQPRISFDEGLSKTISWYKENRWWWEKLR